MGQGLGDFRLSGSAEGGHCSHPLQAEAMHEPHICTTRSSFLVLIAWSASPSLYDNISTY